LLKAVSENSCLKQLLKTVFLRTVALGIYLVTMVIMQTTVILTVALNSCLKQLLKTVALNSCFKQLLKTAA
jgi:hypothetical protein